MTPLTVQNRKLLFVLKLLLQSLAVGIVCGLVGTLFSSLIVKVTAFRTLHGWLVCFLPLAGLLVVLPYKLFSVSGVDTNRVLQAANGKNDLPPLIAVAVFSATVISHLFGASVGREGAALQLGGGLAVTFAKLFKSDAAQKQVLVRVGMAGLFSAVFNTPLTAFFFALEIVCVGSIPLLSVFPCLVSSFSAFAVSRLLNAPIERFSFTAVSPFSFDSLWKILLLTGLCILLGLAFCKSLSLCRKVFATFLPNEFLRVAVGGVLLFALTAIVGNQDYNGAGIHVISRIFETRTFRPEAFLLKWIFTCVSMGCGFKGGEIIPTIFIGATFGALISSIIGLPVAFGAALGVVILFCCVTNCPLSSLCLGAELFSFAGVWYFLPLVAVTFLVSGKTSLYHAQQRKI